MTVGQYFCHDSDFASWFVLFVVVVVVVAAAGVVVVVVVAVCLVHLFWFVWGLFCLNEIHVLYLLEFRNISKMFISWLGQLLVPGLKTWC